MHLFVLFEFIYKNNQFLWIVNQITLSIMFYKNYSVWHLSLSSS